MTNNYIIAVNETGEPFIAHASGLGSWKNRAVKYIKKVKDGKSTRYFYTQKELNDYYNKTRKTNNKQTEQRRSTRDASDWMLGYDDEWTEISPSGFSGTSGKTYDEYELHLVNSKTRKGKTKPGYDQNENRPRGHQKNVAGPAKDGWATRREMDIYENTSAFGENRNQKAIIDSAKEFADELKDEADYVKGTRTELDDAREGMHFAKKLYDDAVKNYKKDPSSDNERYVFDMEDNYKQAKDEYRYWLEEFDWAQKQYRNDLETFKEVSNDYSKASKLAKKRGITNWGMIYNKEKDKFCAYDFEHHTWLN